MQHLVSARQPFQFLSKLSAASQAMWGSLVLSGVVEGSPENPITWSSGLRVSSGVLERVSRRAGLVAKPPYPMEWEYSDSETSSGSDSVRCVASWLGGGGVCNGMTMGGSWSPLEQLMHINYSELLAADLAVRTFLKDHHGVSVLLQLDNSTAMACINNLGGTVTPSVTWLAKNYMKKVNSSISMVWPN